MDSDPYPNNISSILTPEFFTSGTLVYGLAIIALIFLSAFFSGSEVAFFGISRHRLNGFSQSKNSDEKAVWKLMQKPERFLANVLVGNNMVNIALVILFEFFIRRNFHFGNNEIIQFLISLVLVTLILLIFGEVMPKVMAKSKSEIWAKRVAKIFLFLNYLFSVFSLPLIFISGKIGSLSKRNRRTDFSVDTLTQALEASSTTEKERQEDKKMLEGIISFGKTEAKQVMTPRIKMTALQYDYPFDKVKRIILNTGYSRLPVYKDDIDNIVGVLYIKDLLKNLSEENFDWQALLRKPFFVPQNRKIDDILVDFQDKKMHLAIVVDEYGGTSGIISMDDIIEEIVGDISDEFDDDMNLVSKISSNSYRLDGQIMLKDFYRALEFPEKTSAEFEKEKGDADTLAGFILEIAGAFPKKGDVFSFKNYDFKIEALDKKRIKLIILTVKENQHPENEIVTSQTI